MSQYMEVVATQDLINDISTAVETQALSTKQDKLTAGSNITIDANNEISASVDISGITGVSTHATYTQLNDSLNTEDSYWYDVHGKNVGEAVYKTYHEYYSCNTKIEAIGLRGKNVTFRIYGTCMENSMIVVLDQYSQILWKSAEDISYPSQWDKGEITVPVDSQALYIIFQFSTGSSTMSVEEKFAYYGDGLPVANPAYGVEGNAYDGYKALGSMFLATHTSGGVSSSIGTPMKYDSTNDRWEGFDYKLNVTTNVSTEVTDFSFSKYQLSYNGSSWLCDVPGGAKSIKTLGSAKTIANATGTQLSCLVTAQQVKDYVDTAVGNAINASY